MISLLLISTPLHADPTTQPAGLDSLGNDALLNELASRNLDDLLTREFQLDHIPASQQSAIRSLASLQKLNTDNTLTPAERDQLLQAVITNIDQVLPNLPNDPHALMDTGRIIAEQSVDTQTGILEYWGESPSEKSRLHPAADAAVKIFDRANQLAVAQANDIANRITSPDDKLADTWQKANDLAGAAAYQKARMQYALALSMDARDPKRFDLIDSDLKTFAQWDTPDSGIQPQVRLLMAKLNVLQGDKSSIAAAKTLLDSLITRSDNPVAPPPTPTLTFEAECFKVITAIQANDAPGAASALADAKADQQKNFPTAADQIVAIRLLDYRLLALAADQSVPGPAKDRANATAVAALNQLMTDYPGLKTVILRQLASRLPDNADLTTLDPLLLSSMVDQGRQQIVAAGSDPIADKSQLTRALAAAIELLRRYNAKQIPADNVIDASLLIGFFDEYLGDKPAAVDALLDHINRFGSNPAAKSDIALERARVLIADLRDSTPVLPDGQLDPQIRRLLDRFLPIAINPPFNHREFAMQFAAILFTEKKWPDAIQYYKLVPDSEDPPRLLTARYGQLVALKNLVEESPNLPQDQKLEFTDEIQTLASQIKDIANNLIQSSPSDTQKRQAKSTLAHMSLVAADITRRQQNDPQRVLDLLNGFEDSVQGLPDSKSLLNGALFLRVQAFMQLGRNNDATSTLVKFLENSGQNEGAQTVHDLLETLNTDLDRARTAGDTAQIRQLAANRAMLSGFLVKWAQDNSDPKIHAYAYTYSRFDADTKRLAATLESDPTQRQHDLQTALALYKQLQSPENFALYQSTLPPGTDKDYPDPLVTLGIGLIAYDLSDPTTVRDTLGPLIRDEKLGEDNDQYWEATFKLLDSLHTLAKNGDPTASDDQVGKSLKLLYLIWREGTGGPKYHDKFEALRKTVLPDWSPPATNPAAP